jgi:hypothetical protein
VPIEPGGEVTLSLAAETETAEPVEHKANYIRWHLIRGYTVACECGWHEGVRGKKDVAEQAFRDHVRVERETK